jgi:CreA protein
VSNFQRPLTERLSKDFFSDPSYASVGCAKTGPIEVAENVPTTLQGEQVFEESKSLLFKSLRVQRLYDVEKKTVIYVSFNTRLDKNEDSNKSRFKSSICAVSLE